MQSSLASELHMGHLHHMQAQTEILFAAAAQVQCKQVVLHTSMHSAKLFS